MLAKTKRLGINLSVWFKSFSVETAFTNYIKKYIKILPDTTYFASIYINSIGNHVFLKRLLLPEFVFLSFVLLCVFCFFFLLLDTDLKVLTNNQKLIR